MMPVECSIIKLQKLLELRLLDYEHCVVVAIVEVEVEVEMDRVVVEENHTVGTFNVKRHFHPLML
jgi:hypothetical protein